MKVQIEGFIESHEVFEDGVVVNVITRHVLTPTVNPNGYLKVTLNNKGRKLQVALHRLVAEHFIPNPGKFPQVNHIDGNKLNNHKDNLEWCTCSQNRQHAITNNLVPNKQIVIPYENIPKVFERNLNGESIRDLAKVFNVHEKCLASTLRRYAKINNRLAEYSSAGKKAKGAAQVKNRKSVLQYDLQGNFIAKHVSINAAAKAIGIKSPGSISNALNRNTMGKSNNFLWSWDDNPEHE